ncbi:MAG: ABC transporter ATP-binding protein [Candidatus Dormibacteraeota bacterium]|nr:ABC transporter ATP-binding protein [Candidatus Dormibacteraeota bacterium]
MSTPLAAIDTHSLTKNYGRGKGLFGLDLRVEPGELFGFLGPNGSGKTTTIRLLMGLIRATGGSAAIFGLDCSAQSVQVKRLVGYLPGELPQFGGLRGREVVTYLGSIRGHIDERSVGKLAERIDLDLAVPFRSYSRGNKQKLGIVLALMHRPRLLILDEPTGGLDPLNQKAFYDLLREARDGGSTVFLSSHVLSEVEQVCDRVGIIRQGSLVKLASLAELHSVRVHRMDVEFSGEVPEAQLRATEGIFDLQRSGSHLTFSVSGGFGPALRTLSAYGVSNLVSHEPTLEETFLTYYRDPVAEPGQAKQGKI